MHYFSNKFSKMAKRFALRPQRPLIFDFGYLKLRDLEFHNKAKRKIAMNFMVCVLIARLNGRVVNLSTCVLCARFERSGIQILGWFYLAKMGSAYSIHVYQYHAVSTMKDFINFINLDLFTSHVFLSLGLCLLCSYLFSTLQN